MGDEIVKKSGAIKTSTGGLDIQAMRERRKALEVVHGGNSGLQMMAMFDITGSTFKYFELIRKNLREITSAVKKETPSAEFSISAFRNHGDEGSYEQIYYMFPMTGDIEKIHTEIMDIEDGGGGKDGLTCMEDCLREANRLFWNRHSAKALIIIGDEPPHGVVDRTAKCPMGIDYRDEIRELKKKGIKIYSVFCGSKEDVRAFYRSSAEETGGRLLEINEIDILKDLIVGICMKETGNLKKFVQTLRQHKSLDQRMEKALLLLE